MAMTTKGTRGSNQLMQLGRKPAAKAAPKFEPAIPIRSDTKIEPGKTYRLLQKKGSRGKGTRMG